MKKLSLYLMELFTEITLTNGNYNQIKICKIPRKDDGEFSFAILDEMRANLGKSVDVFSMQPSNSSKDDAFFEEYRYKTLEEALLRVKDYFTGHKSAPEVDGYIAGEKREMLKNLKPEVKELLGLDQ
jgi:hypothetical protein